MHFRRFVASIADGCRATRPSRLTAIRQIYIGLWTLFVWGREAGNTESGYLCSEYSVLVAWSLVKDQLEGGSKGARQLWQSMKRLLHLHMLITEDYIDRYVARRAKARHGLSAAVPSRESLDVNLRLFDLLGRVSLQGIWSFWVARIGGVREGTEKAFQDKIHRLTELVVDMVQNNPILVTPIKDDQAIDINIACLFLRMVGCHRFIKGWIGQIARATVYAFQTSGAFPCMYRDYHDLIERPEGDSEYRVRATRGSILVPTLAVWAALTEDTETLEILADFASEPFKHSTLQLWYPGDDSEDHMYRGNDDHGLAATNIKIVRSCGAMLSPIRAECDASCAFQSLSAIRRRLWPLVIAASRHHRMPVPPQFWAVNETKSGTSQD